MLRSIKDVESFKLTDQLWISGFAVLIGAVVGLVDTVFGKGLLMVTAIRSNYFMSLIPFLGLIGIVVVGLYRRYGGKASKGMAQVFAVGHGEDDSIPIVLVPLIILTTWLTHLFGGSAGREGVAVQLGATLSNSFSRWLKMEKAPQLFLLIGVAAGFSGLFQTPIAATFFALEVLVIGRISVSYLLPILLASFTAAWASHGLGLEKFKHLVSSQTDFELGTLVKLALLGLVFGAVGTLFAFLHALAKEKLALLIKNPYVRILVVGLFLSIILVLADQGRYSGLGTNLIDQSFLGGSIKSYDWLLKLSLTILTLSAGFQGGEVTPLFAIGSSLGVVLAGLFQLPVELVAACGYIAVFGSATNTFLTPIFIGGEVFGFENTPYFFVVVAFAYSLNFKRSIYSNQKLLEH